VARTLLVYHNGRVDKIEGHKMDGEKKLAFIASQTAKALDHMSRTPNVVTPDGKMSHDKMLGFVTAVTKHGLQHYDSGGAVSAQSVPAPGAIPAPSAPGVSQTGSVVASPGSTVNNTGLVGSIGNALGLNNNFQAGAAGIQQGTNSAQINQAYSGAQEGLGAQSNIADTLTPGVYQGAQAQSNLSNMLMNQANGAGPNPAQAQYAENAANIAKQQAGAAASAKGISPALAARLVSEQGGQATQAAAGQEATLAAQQQLAAEQNLQNLSANQVAQGATAVQGVNNAQQNEQQILQGANTSANNAAVGMQSNINNVNSQVAAANQQQAGNIVSGIGSALSKVPIIGSLFAEKGGMVHVPKMYADGGGVTGAPTSGPQSYVGQWLNSSGGMSSSGPQIQPTSAAANKGGLMKKGGPVKAANAKEKAQVPGDSLKNDKVPAMLSEGELVIDRDTMKDPGPMGQMARALAMHISKRNKK
jgi:hypothetical protein